MKSKGKSNKKKGNHKGNHKGIHKGSHKGSNQGKFKQQHGNQDAKNKKFQPQNKKTKLHIKFNNEDRRDYLKGFQKRKQKRRKEALEQMEKDLKQEMNTIRSERKQMMKKMLHQEIPDFTKVDEDDKEYNSDENPDALVTTCGSATVEISELDLSSPLTIKPNTVSEIDEKEEDDGDKNDDDGIPLYTKENLLDLGIHTERELKRSIRQNATKVMQANKLIQKKEQRHSREQRKQQRRRTSARRKLKSKKMKRRQGGKPKRDD